MKKIIMVLLVSMLSVSMFAQKKADKPQLTETQKTELKAVRDSYAPQMKELQSEMRVLMVEQDVLLKSKVIDKKAVLATVEKIGALKVEMQQQRMDIHMEMQKIAPEMAKMHKSGSKGKGQCKMSAKGEDGMRHGKGEMREDRGRDKEQCHKSDECSKDGSQEIASCDKRPEQGRGEMKKRSGKCESGKMDKKGCDKYQGLNLSPEQKEMMAELKKNSFWKIQEMENEIALLKAKNSTPELKMKSMDKISDLQIELAKEKMSLKIDMMNVLTEEQRMKAISSHKGGDRGQMKGRRQHGA